MFMSVLQSNFKAPVIQIYCKLHYGSDQVAIAVQYIMDGYSSFTLSACHSTCWKYLPRQIVQCNHDVHLMHMLTVGTSKCSYVDNNYLSDKSQTFELLTTTTRVLTKPRESIYQVRVHHSFCSLTEQ